MVQEATAFEDVIKRLKRAERQLRWVKLAGVGLLLLVGAGLMTGQDQPKKRTVEAEKSILLGPSGQTRAELGVGLMSALSLPRLDGEKPKATGLRLYDEDGEVRAGVGAPPGFVNLSLSGGAGRVSLAATPESTGLLLFGKGEEEVIASLAAQEDGPVALELRDERGRPRAVLGCTSLETPHTGAVTMLPPSSLVLFDKEGKVVFRAP